jgi:uncharacterized protein (DUF58 family)
MPVTQPPTAPYLLSPQFLRKLEQATVATKRIFVGRTKGERRSARRGSSVEFADYRSYVPGDDLRYLDWSAFARLQRLFLKLFVEEEDLHVYFLLDTSQSMAYGEPGKLTWAVQAAAALAYMALCAGDRTQLFGHAEGRGEVSRSFRGRGVAPDLFAWLQGLSAEGGTSLSTAVRGLQAMASAPGLTFLVSDLMAPDWEESLARLAAGRGDCCVLHLFSPEEFEPTAQGDLKLIDSETEEVREITMGPTVLRQYRAERDAFLQRVRGACHRYGFSYLFATTDQSVEDMVLRSLRQLQVVR